MFISIRKPRCRVAGARWKFRFLAYIISLLLADCLLLPLKSAARAIEALPASGLNDVLYENLETGGLDH